MMYVAACGVVQTVADGLLYVLLCVVCCSTWRLVSDGLLYVLLCVVCYSTWRIVSDGLLYVLLCVVCCRTWRIVLSMCCLLQHVEWFWRQTLICDGSEASLEQCRYRLHYNLEQCMIERRYVFMRCGARNLPTDLDYWGNVRFATPNFESATVMPGYSSLDYVDIYGAGILHGDRVAAVQVSDSSIYTIFADLRVI